MKWKTGQAQDAGDYFAVNSLQIIHSHML